MDNLFEQMANISKAGAYDILVEQVGELKKENTKLREALKTLVENKYPNPNIYHGAIYFEMQSKHAIAEFEAKEALKVTKFS